MKDFQLLDQFIDRKCEVSFHYLTEDKLSASYNYNLFSYELDNEYISLLDKNDNDCRTYVHLDEVIEVTNLTDDLYTTVVSIKYKDKVISICCAEQKPVPIRCDKCGHVFDENEQIWSINQQGEYGSIYDGDWISKRLCDSCVSWLVEGD